MFPCMSNSPQALGFFRPTPWGRFCPTADALPLYHACSPSAVSSSPKQNFADEPAFLELVKTPGDVLTFQVERDGQLRTVIVQLPVDAAGRAA